MARKKHKRPHGTGSMRMRNGRVQVQWTRADGTRGTKTVDATEAVSFLMSARKEVSVTPVPTGRLADLAETWLAGRSEMASNYDDRNRWKNHLLPALGDLTPNEVTVPVLKKLIVTLRQKGLSKGTIRLCIAVVSSLYGDLVEDGVADLNPAKLLSSKTRQNDLTSDWDTQNVPFIKDLGDIRRVWKTLDAADRQIARAFVIGALAGLRTSEIRALRWEHVDFERMVIHVNEQVARRGGGVTTLKDGESRIVPMSHSLSVIIQPDRRLNGLVCSDNGGYLDLHRIGRAIANALALLELPKMRWYDATRHTFASQWVLNGGTLETLREMMGHSSVTMTERYAHLIPGRYSDADRARVAVEITPPTRVVTN